MADRDKYKFHGTKTRGEKIGSLKLSGGRVLVKDGPAVELSDAEVERFRERGYILHKTSSGSAPKEPESEQSDDNSEDNES